MRRLRLKTSGRHRRTELVAGVAVLGLVIAACVFVPILNSTDPRAFVATPFEAPSWSHPFGTDSYGRDVFVRVFVGGRLDLAIAAIALALSLAIGTWVGIVAGATRRRWIDAGIMRIVDAIVAFPFIILTLTLIVVIGNDWELGPLPSGAATVILGIVLVNWTWYARLARSQTLTLRDRDYVVAAGLLGYSRRRVMLGHLLPGVGRVTASYAVADVVLLITWAASLSFLGVGIAAPTPEWGSIMYEGRTVLSQAWWITTIPGVLLVITGVSVSAIADSLLSEDAR